MRRPTSAELLEAIAGTLTTRVMPAVEDPVVLSELRSTVALVRHLALRVEAEPALLVAEADDLSELLTGWGQTPPDRPSLESGDVAALADHVEELRVLLDAEVATAYTAADDDRLATLDAYLARHAARYLPLLAEPFSRGWA